MQKQKSNHPQNLLEEDEQGRHAIIFYLKKTKQPKKFNLLSNRGKGLPREQQLD
jgi:hypothetical protein